MFCYFTNILLGFNVKISSIKVKCYEIIYRCRYILRPQKSIIVWTLSVKFKKSLFYDRHEHILKHWYFYNIYWNIFLRMIQWFYYYNELWYGEPVSWISWYLSPVGILSYKIICFVLTHTYWNTENHTSQTSHNLL